jgi:hypothetical protein
LGNLADYNAWPDAISGFNPLVRGLPEDAINFRQNMSAQTIVDALRRQTREIDDLVEQGKQYIYGSPEAQQIFAVDLPPLRKQQRDLARILMDRVGSDDPSISQEAISALRWNASDLSEAVITGGDARHIGRLFGEVYDIDPDFFTTYRGARAGGVELADAMLRYANSMTKEAGSLPVSASPAQQLVTSINTAAKQAPDTVAASPGMRQIIENATTGFGRSGKVLAIAAGVVAAGLLAKNLVNNDPFLERPRSSALPPPTTYVQQEEENQGMRISIRGRVRGGSREIADAVQRSVQTTMGQPMNLNLNIRDNTSQINRQHINNMLSDLNSYGYIPRRR